MSNLQMIENLCGIVEECVRLVRRMSCKLEEKDALDAAEREEVANIMSRYSETLGADELPEVD